MNEIKKGKLIVLHTTIKLLIESTLLFDRTEVMHSMPMNYLAGANSPYTTILIAIEEYFYNGAVNYQVARAFAIILMRNDYLLKSNYK